MGKGARTSATRKASRCPWAESGRFSSGVHSGFFNLVKVNGRWLIANWIDHGVEEG